MPKNITQYRVFIGSPSGLEHERKGFRDVLHRFNKVHARKHDVEFEPVGWEDTLPGQGRPQEKINDDLRRCDYAIFAFHDRWGSATGNGTLVGTEEEWEIAEQLYGAEGGYQIRQMALYFKSVPAPQVKDPGEEYKKVLAFKNRIFSGKRHLCGGFDTAEQFAGKIEEHLAEWLARHLKPVDDEAFSLPTTIQGGAGAPLRNSSFSPDFDFWMEEASKSLSETPVDHAASLTFLTNALKIAQNEKQVIATLYKKGVTLGAMGRNAEAIAVYDDLIARFGTSDSLVLQEGVAKALISKGVRLGAMGRNAEAIAVYDDLIGQFGTSDVPALQERVANARFNKGVRLGSLGRDAEAIAVYDELISRFEASDVPALQERVGKALVNKGVRLNTMGRDAEAIAVYDDLISRYSTSDVLALQEQVAKALINKGIGLGESGRNAEALTVYDDLIRRFGTSDAPALQEQVARALISKGVRLGESGHSAEAIVAYDDLLRRFSSSDAPALQELVARALVNKGIRLAELGHSVNAIEVFDDVIARFGRSDSATLQEGVARALINKGANLGESDRSFEAIAAYDELIRRFDTSEEPALRDRVIKALYNKACEFAKKSKVTACITTLGQWSAKRGDIDCHCIMHDKDFDSIRSRPAFLKYIRQAGCLG